MGRKSWFTFASNSYGYLTIYMVGIVPEREVNIVLTKCAGMYSEG